MGGSCGTAQLAVGKHEALVNFFENDGYAACTVTWSGPDTNNAEVLLTLHSSTLMSSMFQLSGVLVVRASCLRSSSPAACFALAWPVVLPAVLLGCLGLC